jgi:predicted nucleic acid-binding protein
VAGRERPSLPIGKTLYARAVLMDTGAILALADHSDPHHNDATECLQAIARHRLPVFIIVPTIYEAHRRFLFDHGQPAANYLLDAVYDGSTNIVRTVDEDEQEARRLIQRYAALEMTLTDGACMAVMTRLRIAACFSFDVHFLQAGYIRIPPFHLR